MLDNSAVDTWVPENAKEAKKIFNENRKNMELNRKGIISSSSNVVSKK
jgi:hypothetical protein